MSSTFLLLAILAATWFFVKSVLTMMFGMQNYTQNQKRMKQLDYKQKKEEKSMDEIIDIFTRPVQLYILPKLNIGNNEQLEKDLRIAKWDKTFKTANIYRATDYTLKILGLVMLALLGSSSMIFGGVWFAALFFGLGFFKNNTKKNRLNKLMKEFPDFIRICQGFLSSKMTFIDSVEHSLVYLNDDWKEILREFIQNATQRDIGFALEELKETIAVFEVQEFVALVRLTLSQGGEVVEGFTSQATRIKEMQKDLMLSKIRTRQTMSTALQFPLLITIFIIVGLPTFSSMTSFSSM